MKKIIFFFLQIELEKQFGKSKFYNIRIEECFDN